MTSRVIYDKQNYKYSCALGVHQEEQFAVLDEYLKMVEEMRFIDIEKEAEKTRQEIIETQKEWRKECEEENQEFLVHNPKKRKGRRGRKKSQKKKERKRGDWKKFQTACIYAIRANRKLQMIMAEDYGVPYLMTGHTTQGHVFLIFRIFFQYYLSEQSELGLILVSVGKREWLNLIEGQIR